MIFQLLVISCMTPLIFVCLWRASNWDCGRLPKEDIDRELDTASVQTCHKCGALRNDPFVHHCSRCDSCIENMDHHCTFLGQCVGRKNMKYFFQFCCYMFALLFYATCKLLRFFYTDNVTKQLGVQGITWIFPLTPYHLLYVFYYSEAEGGYSALRTIDNLLFIQCVGFCFFCVKIVWSVISNLRTRTSAPD